VKSFFRNFGKKSNSQSKEKPASWYRIPEMIWMADVKKAAERGAFLVKKPNLKKNFPYPGK
jgi:hypothetical protein